MKLSSCNQAIIGQQMITKLRVQTTQIEMNSKKVM